MTYSFRPAVRENTPLIIGIAGPTKSGKTYSAHRLAIGLVAAGSPIVMINAEGPRGHQYADKFKYLACDLTPPYRPTSYTEALQAAAKLTPGVVIIDSGSHMHDGPGGILEWHEEEVERISKGKDDDKARDRANFAAWVKPKAAENEFIYAMLEMKCPVILCLRAKEKIKLVPGKPPEDLGWQPIVGERVAFETIFTLMLPPFSKGVPELALSQMREPFDAMVPKGKPIDEDLGRKLAEWARGASKPAPSTSSAHPERTAVLEELKTALTRAGLAGDSDAQKKQRAEALAKAFGTASWAAIQALDVDKLRAGIAKLAPAATAAPSADPDDHPLLQGPKNDSKAELVTEIAAVIAAWRVLTPTQVTAFYVTKLGTEDPSTASIEKLLDLRKFAQRVTDGEKAAVDELDGILIGCWGGPGGPEGVE
jgi:hypothetical protein